MKTPRPIVHEGPKEKLIAECRGRDGAPPIDLIDGERLAELLKELQLGIRTETIEKVDVDEGWFDGI